MSQQPPPPFRFSGPPQLPCFPRGHFQGPPPPPPVPPQAFPPSPAFPPFPGLGSPSYPPPRPPFPPQLPGPPPWQQERRPPPFQWRPEASASSSGPRGSGDSSSSEDEAWLRRFVAQRRASPPKPAPPAPLRFGPNEAGLLASEALRLVARVASLCGAWRRRDDEAEAGEVAEAEAGMAELRRTVAPLRETSPSPPLAQLRRRLEKSRQKRLRRRRRRQEARAARQEEEARVAEEEARIERWRARRAQEVEDRHREKELKAAADSVLSEVRKKQADTKRMAEILRGLEKLRKLRKEAAGRKGVCPPPSADEAFENEVQSLRALIKKRTELYEAEERALRVMLEGEQEEERKRDLERKQRKEREKLLQQKREMDSKLFGEPDEFPLAHILEPFTQYYLQAEYSVPALIQIRHEWDRYLVPADHPEGHCIAPGWVLPTPPSNDIWATAVR
ncbi:programmed cell death protein 7 [Sceloporus undulatus]|uniref:programmed cell death protein 7 n=1 Tax=Sceloporus undulatus TaxID=8520 RepID=UPI001C4CB9D0|nr:programmed cell death protein 7 [Sceloporus undulatus]